MNIELNNNIGINHEATNMIIPNQEANQINDETKKNTTGEEIVGDGDIVIDEDFDINLDIADVSADSISGTKNESESEIGNATQNVELGTEQTGNITF